MTLFSMKTLYAIQALVLLARDDAASLSSRQLASRGALPLRYLEGILVELKRAGLVESLRGSGGGYRLCRPATEIQFIDVVEALEGPLQLVRPTEGHDQASSDMITMRAHLAAATDALTGVLTSTSIAALVPVVRA